MEKSTESTRLSLLISTQGFLSGGWVFQKKSNIEKSTEFTVPSRLKSAPLQTIGVGGGGNGAAPPPAEGGADKLNVAVTDLASVIVITQLPVPLQAPDQPAKSEPAAGVAVSVTIVPLV